MYFLDYALHNTQGYEAGYGEHDDCAYFILDNTGDDSGYWPCLITFRINITYLVIGYNSSGEIVSTSKAVYAPYSLSGDNNYTTEIVGYVPSN